jgi:signal transduction histidine kinase
VFGFDRRYVLLPVVAFIAMILAGFLIARQSEHNLAATRERVAAIEQRQHRVADLLELILNAETGQRGYVITGDESFLDPYRATLDTRAGVLQRLRDAYGRDAGFAAIEPALTAAVSRRFTQLDDVVRLRGRSIDAAADYIRARQGKVTMDEIRTRIAGLSIENDRVLDRLRDAEVHDVTVLRRVIASGAALNVLLVLLGGVLLTRDLRRRAQGAVQLQRENTALESKVHERNAELEALSTHLQDVTERERGALARELHDELGGLLTAAKMDVAWLQSHIPRGDNPALRWTRLVSVLDAGVDLKRRIVEQLRPSLLDNMGLMVALRWQLQESCTRGGLQFVDDLPEEELELNGAAAIALFRIAQEAMTNVITHAQATRVYIGIVVEEDTLQMTLRDDGRGLPPQFAGRTHGLAGMRHRAEALGGTLKAGPDENGRGTEITVRLPLSRVLATATVTGDAGLTNQSM